MPLADTQHNERNTEKSYTAQFTRSEKFNGFHRPQNKSTWIVLTQGNFRCFALSVLTIIQIISPTFLKFTSLL